MADLTGQTIGGYPLEKPLRAESYQVTYRATTSADPIAIKVLREDLRADPALNEAVAAGWEAARAIVSETLVGILGCGQDPQYGAYCLQEFQELKALRKIVIDGMSLSWRDTIEIARGIANALKILHDGGVLHGHPWPGNVLLTLDQDVKLEGAGTIPNQPVRPLSEIIRGAALGYVAPERLRGASATPGTDLYGLGGCLYNMFTQQDPFPETDQRALIDAIVTQPPTPARTLNTQLPAEVDTFLERLLAKDPARRYASVNDVIADLHALKTGAPLADLKSGTSVPDGPVQYPQAAPAQNPPVIIEGRPQPAERVAQQEPHVAAQASHARIVSDQRPARKRADGMQSQFFGRLKTHVDSTLAQSPKETRGDDLFRKGQLSEALKAWQAAWEAGSSHPGLRAKIELGQFTLNKEIFDNATHQVRFCLAEGLIEGAREHYQAAKEAAGNDPERQKLLAMFEVEIASRDYEIHQKRKLKVIVGVVVAVIALIGVVVLILLR